MDTGLSESNRVEVMDYEINNLVNQFVEQLEATDAFKHFKRYMREELEAQDVVSNLPTPENMRHLQYAQQTVQNWYKNLVQKQPEIKTIQALCQILKALKQWQLMRQLEVSKLAVAAHQSPCTKCIQDTCSACTH